MARVFISYARADHALAAEVHYWLTQAGHEVFLDRDPRDGIALGDEWEARLRERLRWADAIVSLITTPYLQSLWCTFELTIARDRGSRVLPVIAEEGVRHPLLKPVQYVDRNRARDALVEVLGRIDAAGGSGWPDDLSPFPGLESFGAERRRVFFGRGAEANELAGRLRSPAAQALGAVLMVVGPSGCGKSSLVRAGVLPILADEAGWLTLLPFRPGADPVGELARGLAAAARLSSLDWTPGTVREQLTADGLTAVVDELLAATSGRRRRLLIVLDQAEELVTQTSPEQCADFVGLLQPALSGPISVIATLRPEFLERFQVAPELAGLPTSPYLVGPLGREALRGVIEGPARVAGIEVSDELVAKMVDDTSSGDALPLLAFTLEQLAEGVHRGGQLSAARYKQLDGVQGALTRQAELALRAAVESGGRTEQEVIDGLLRLVAIDDDGRPTRWLRDRSELPEPVARDLDAFVERRLLTTSSRGEGAQRVVEIGVAHEAFLTAWAPLREAIAAQRTVLRAQRAIEQAAAEWHRQGRPADRLWERGQLAAAVNDIGGQRRRNPPAAQADLSPTGRDFLHQSTTRDRRRRLRGTAILSVLLAMALTAAGIAVVQGNAARRQQAEAQSQRRTAIARQLVAQAEIAQPSDPRTALRLALAADAIDSSPQTRSSLVSRLLSSRYAGTLTGHTGGISEPSFTADGKLMATTAGDDRAILWDLAGSGQPEPIGKPLSYEGDDNNLGGVVVISPDGRTLASTLQYPSGVVLWDISDPANPRRRGATIDPKVKQIARLAFTPDSKTLVVAANSPVTVSFWRTADATRVGAQVPAGASFLEGLWFFADSKVLVTAALGKASARQVRRWDLRNPADPRELGEPIIYNSAAAFDPTRRLLATDGPKTFNSEVILRDLSNPAVPREAGPRQWTVRSSVSALIFSPDGRSLAITSFGDAPNTTAARLVDLTDLKRPVPYEQPLDRGGRPIPGGYSPKYIDPGVIFGSLVFVPGTAKVATISGDGSIRLWDLSVRAEPRQIGEPITGGTGQDRTVAVLPDGRRLLTARSDGSIVLWDITDAGTPRAAGPPLTVPGVAAAAEFSPDGRMLSVGYDGSVTRFDLTEPARPRPVGSTLNLIGAKGARAISFSRGGALVAVGDTNQIIVQEVANPARRTVLKKPFFSGKYGDAPVGDLTFSTDGRLLAIGLTAFGSYLSLWDSSDPGQVRRAGDVFEPVDFSGAVAFAATGSLMARSTGAGGPVGAELWDVSTPSSPRRRSTARTGHTRGVMSLALASDGKLLASGSQDGTVILTDLSDLEHPAQLGLPLAPGFDAVHSLAFSPDGSLLAAGAENGTVVLWDLADPNRPRQLGGKLPAQASLARVLSFSPDGRTLAAAGPVSGDNRATGLVGLTDLSGLVELREQPTEQACGRVGEGLSAAEWARYVGDLPYQQTC